MKKKYIQAMQEMWPKYGIEYKLGIGYDNESGKIIKQ
jgi:hypothetical protein